MKYRMHWLPTTLALVLWPAVASAAPDDEEPAPVDQEAQEFVMADEHFDQWVFQASGNAAAARERITARLRLQVAEIDRVCQLTAAQKQKLMLAARADIRRFFDEVDDVRQQFEAKKKDQNALNGIWEHIQPLHTKLARGLFGESSFFAKSLRKTLTPEQLTQYKAIVDARRRFRYQANVEAALVSLGNSVALRSEQHDALAKLLLDEPKPPQAMGQYSYYIVMQRLAKMPEDKVKPLVDERQWKLLQQHFNQFRGMQIPAEYLLEAE